MIPGVRVPSVAVVMCVYTEDRFADIVVALRALAAQTRRPEEIVVVVDHNEALAARLAGQIVLATLPQLRVVPNAATRGLSGARNTGVAATRSDIVAFLDDDACPEPDWLAELVAPFSSPGGRDVAAVGGRAVPVWPSQRPGWWPSEFDWVVGCSYTGLPTTTSEVRNVIGASMALTRDALELGGGFREGVGRVGANVMGCEETELCIRIRQQRPDAVVLYAPGSLVHHRVAPNRVTWAYFRSRCYAEGLSKAQISAAVGSGDATATERSYATRVLPVGALKSAVSLLRGDRHGPARAAAIVVGLLTTTLGFVRGRLPTRRRG